LNVVGVDDGSFPADKTTKAHALLLAVLLRNTEIRGIRVGTIEVDGTDARTVLKPLVRALSPDLVMLSGVSFAGFNVIDISRLAHELKKPIIAISGDRPDNKAVRTALKDHFPDWETRWRSVHSAGRLYSCKPLKHEPKLYFEVKGATPNYARNVISRTAVISRLPEPIRVARIIAKGLSSLATTRLQ
jgi:endonuclease V-like protein UPF0215 family